MTGVLPKHFHACVMASNTGTHLACADALRVHCVLFLPAATAAETNTADTSTDETAETSALMAKWMHSASLWLIRAALQEKVCVDENKVGQLTERLMCADENELGS